MLGQAVLAAAVHASHDASPLAVRMEGDIPLGRGTEVVINCAGIVKGRVASPASYIRVNSLLPWELYESCERVGARLIQVSTDCVFDGLVGPHAESDPPAPIDLYGRNKLAGEVDHPHLTIRTSFVGKGRRGLIAELERYSQAGLPYPASIHQQWTGHCVQWIAGLLVQLATLPLISGLLHVPGTETTRCSLVHDLRDTLGLTLEIQIADKPVVDRRLISTRWGELGLPKLPEWTEELMCLQQNRSVW
jgi:dTDP-4-dehydrorhamnose reductase